MDVNAFFRAYDSPAYIQWKNAKQHIAPWTEMDVIQVISSFEFKEWLENNPNGSIDQYYIYTCQRKQFIEAPHYQIKFLQEENTKLKERISSIQNQIYEQNAKIGDLEETITRLEAKNTMAIFLFTFVLLVLILAIVYKFKSINHNERI